MTHDETQYVSRLREAMLKGREKKTKEQLRDELREIEEQIECEKLKVEIARKKRELDDIRSSAATVISVVDYARPTLGASLCSWLDNGLDTRVWMKMTRTDMTAPAGNKCRSYIL